MKSEIYSYSRSRGVFVGVSLDGSAITIRQDSTNAFYQQPPFAANGTIPPSASPDRQSDRLQPADAGRAGFDHRVARADVA